MGGEFKGPGKEKKVVPLRPPGGCERDQLRELTGFLRTDGGPSGTLSVIPSRLVSADEAIAELERFLPGEGNSVTKARLCCPDTLRVRLTPFSIELTDEFSQRPASLPPSPDEPLESLSSWVNYWYVAVIKKPDGTILGRFMDRAHPTNKCGPFELPIHVPGSDKYSLERFLRTISDGGPY